MEINENESLEAADGGFMVFVKCTDGSMSQKFIELDQKTSFLDLFKDEIPSIEEYNFWKDSL